MRTQLIDKVPLEVENIYRRHYGKIVSSVLYLSQDLDLKSAEDLVQDAFSLALTAWNNNDIPSNPTGWIYTVCKNKALNQLIKNKRKSTLPENKDLKYYDQHYNESVFEDHQLRLLFACAYPNFSPKVQLIITLKYVVNLKIESIAKIFGMSIDGIDKLLSRARHKIKEENILLLEPDPENSKMRIPIVLKIIYLIFNEGYKASSGKDILKKELCEEALLLIKSLWESKYGNKETAALYALMLFNASRLESRFGYSGELLDLETQDRKKWHQEMIRLGCKFLKKSGGGDISPYHYEASIAFLHCSAKSFAQTDWLSISKLYEKLLALNANPFVDLNYAISLYYSGKKEKGFHILKVLQQNPFLNQYYLLNATLGKINFLEGNFYKAKEFLLKTLQQTNFQLEKDYILKLIHKMDEENKIE
jgi:RNA polymerase sigma factor (sigma-70 family)